MKQLFLFLIFLFFLIPFAYGEEVQNISTEKESFTIIVSYFDTKTVAAGSVRVPVLKFECKNDYTEDILLNQIGFLRKGLGKNEDFNNITIFDGDKRVTEVKINSDHKAIFRIPHKPIKIPKNSVKTFILTANIKSGEAVNYHENSFVIIKNMLILVGKDSSKTITPIINDAAPVYFTILAPTNVKNNLRVSKGPKVGSSRTIAYVPENTLEYFRIMNEGNEDIIIHSIRIKVEYHPEILKDLTLVEVNSDRTICRPGKDKLIFECGENGYIIPRSATRTIAIKGMIEPGTHLKKIEKILKFKLSEAEDIVAETESGLGVNVIDNY